MDLSTSLIKNGWCGQNAYIMQSHVDMVRKWKASSATRCQFGQRRPLQLSSSRKKKNRCVIQIEEAEDRMQREKKTMEA